MSEMQLKRFENTEVWQEARKITKEIYQVSSCEPFAKDWGLRDQIRRASISIMANIAEGSERGTTKEFIYYLGIALGSTAEVRSHIYVAFDLGYIKEEQMNNLTDSLNSIIRQLKGLRRSLQHQQQH